MPARWQRPTAPRASTSMARIAEAQAQLALVDEQLVRGRVGAPFDALVVQGDLSQSIGMPVRQGDTLMTLAAMGRHRVIVEVDETDIARVRPGQPGQLALSSLPWNTHAVVVERITPLAKAVDGRNVFEVEARMEAAPSDMRPGLLGRARASSSAGSRCCGRGSVTRCSARASPGGPGSADRDHAVQFPLAPRREPEAAAVAASAGCGASACAASAGSC